MSGLIGQRPLNERLHLFFIVSRVSEIDPFVFQMMGRVPTAKAIVALVLSGVGRENYALLLILWGRRRRRRMVGGREESGKEEGGEW